jgi:uncharacterized protein
MKKWLLPTVMLFFQTAVFAQQSTAVIPAKDVFDEAYRYLMGLGSPYDPGKAIVLFKKAAAMGNAASMNALGNIYARGEAGVNTDLNTAIAYFKQAGHAGYSTAYYNLAILYKDGELLPQDFKQSAQYTQAGAAIGNSSCKNLLAYYYFKGFGVQQSYSKAFNLYLELAQTGDVNAQYFTGLCYRNGYGVTANQNEAKKWLQQAADNGENQAVHELTEETLPENSSIISPVQEQKVKRLRNYKEKLITASGNDLSGDYKGFAVYYDFSNHFVHQLVPLSLTLCQAANGYQGTWTESDTLAATIKASFFNNNLSFDSSSQYARCNYYSYREIEKYQFKTASLGIKYLNDSMFLSGDVKFYSIDRKEPGQPMYIMLGKKVKNFDQLIKDNLQFTISPNPTTEEIKARFTLSKPGKVNFQVYDIEGKPVINQNTGGVPAGTYTYPIDVHLLAKGSYTISISTTTGSTQNKIFIKL